MPSYTSRSRPRRPMARTDLFQGSDASSILAGATASHGKRRFESTGLTCRAMPRLRQVQLVVALLTLVASSLPQSEAEAGSASHGHSSTTQHDSRDGLQGLQFTHSRPKRRGDFVIVMVTVPVAGTVRAGPDVPRSGVGKARKWPRLFSTDQESLTGAGTATLRMKLTAEFRKKLARAGVVKKKRSSAWPTCH
jgi:hypothetical protein